MDEGEIRLEHGTLHYRHAGGERGVNGALLLHGLLATSFGWRATVAALAEEREAYALDLPGIAGSAPLPRYRAPLSRLAGCVAEFWRARRLGPVVLIGSSWGGAVALATAAEWPEMVERLVLAAPVSPYFRPNWHQRLLLEPAVARCAGGLLRRTPRAWYQAGLEAMWAVPRRLPEDVVMGYWRPLRQARLGTVLAGWVTDWRRELAALEPRLGKIAAPVLLIWGERDRVVPPESAAALRAALPRAECVMLAGAGHLSFEERPREFNAALLRFLAA